MARVAGSSPNSGGCTIDSGATGHISPNLTDFHEYHTLEELVQVDLADLASPATPTGSINFPLECGMFLSVEALYVADFGTFLISVPQLIKDGIGVSFYSHSGTVDITPADFTEATAWQVLARFHVLLHPSL